MCGRGGTQSQGACLVELRDFIGHRKAECGVQGTRKDVGDARASETLGEVCVLCEILRKCDVSVHEGGVGGEVCVRMMVG